MDREPLITALNAVSRTTVVPNLSGNATSRDSTEELNVVNQTSQEMRPWVIYRLSRGSIKSPSYDGANISSMSDTTSMEVISD